MQVLQAGKHEVVLLEIDFDLLRQGIEETGFQAEIHEDRRAITLELEAPERDGPLLLFDASDPANAGWFSRCQFYVDGFGGRVLQTPFTVANRRDPGGRLIGKALDVQITKELPAHFRFPGRQPVSEKTLYAVLFNFLNALQKTGVGVCGVGTVRPLAGRA
jgi:hypothetical protein